MKGALIAVGLAAAAMARGEYAHWRSSHAFLGTRPGSGDREVVVVLGFKNRLRRINAVNRARVRAGLRSRTRPDTLVVFCGGPMGCPIPEAELMAAYARSIGHDGPMALDPTSRDTGENIAHAIPFLEDADRIKIVSNPVHAEIGRRYLWQQRPDLAERLVRGADHRPLAHLPAKPLLAAIGHRTIRRRFPPGSEPPAARRAATPRFPRARR